MKKLATLALCFITYVTLTSQSSCNAVGTPQSASGVSKIDVKVQTDLNGRTLEQNNVAKRLDIDNKAGSIKHLYIISAYSGQVMIYSTVKGKVTSSGKRLTPSSIDGNSGYPADGNVETQSSMFYNNRVTIGTNSYVTNEVLGDDGTYGSSVEYLYWFDSKDIYHQQYVTGGMVVHVSDQPLAVKSVILNMETNKSE